MITCHAAIAPTLANATLYGTFADAVRKTCKIFDYPNTTTLFNTIYSEI